jgi:GH18 family chitinase
MLTNKQIKVTKTGIPNNKIYVGEASYGRSFQIAKDGYWEPICDFTGLRTKSNAHPGRYTKTSGYLAYAKIQELIKKGGGKSFHDSGSNSDILLYQGLSPCSHSSPTYGKKMFKYLLKGKK